MDHITVSGQVVPVPSNWSDADIKNFAAGIKGGSDHITVGGQAYAVPSSWTDKSIQDYANALKTGMRQTAPKPQPKTTYEKINDWGNETVDDSMNFLGNAVSGIGEALNPVNVVKGAVNTVLHPIDTATNLIKTPGTMYQQFKDGDMEGLAHNIGNLAGNVIVGKVMPEVPGTVKATAEAAGKYVPRVVENAPAVGKAATNAAGSAVAEMKKGLATKGVVTAASNAVIPGSGPVVGGALTLHTLYKAAAAAVKDGSMGKLGESIRNLTNPTTAENIADVEARSPWLQNNANQTYADVVAKQQASTASAPAPAPVDPVKSAPVRKAESSAQPMPTTKVEISSRISPDAATSTMGTKAPTTNGDATASYLQGIRNTEPAPASAPVNGNPLDAATHQKLIDATRNGKLEALPADTKVALTRAVKAGDNTMVRSILDGRPHAGVSRTDTSIVNKVAALSKYVIDHPQDLNAIRNSAALVDKFIKDNNLGNPTSRQLRTAAAGNTEVLDAMNEVQTLADAAYGHSVTKHGLIGNKRGRYDGVSLDTIDMVQRTLATVHK